MRRVSCVLVGLLVLFGVTACDALDDFSAVAAQVEQARELSPYARIGGGRLEDGGFYLGDPDAPVAIVEFSDFLCPFCQQYQEVIEQLIDTYVRTGQARFEYRMFPVIDPFLSFQTAYIAECSAELRPADGFWLAHDELYARMAQGQTQDIARQIADALELDYGALFDCVNALQDSGGQIGVDRNLGYELGVLGTPAVMVRYGDAEPVWIERNGRRYDRGGVEFNILAAVIEEAWD